MVKGLDVFRDYFKGFEDSYVLIGGVACDLLMEEAGLEFRATKDLDIVLVAEAMSTEFVEKFWAFVRKGGYQHQEKSTGDKQFYRFNKPGDDNFPFMLELFSRKPDVITLVDDAHLTPIPVDEEISSLSAILLDDDYYQCIQQGKQVNDGVSILGAEFVLAFKARAWLDMSKRKAAGDQVDSKNIKKHRNDVFKLFQLLAPQQKVDVADSIKTDLAEFFAAMQQEPNLDPKSLGIKSRPLDEVLAALSEIYGVA